MVEQSSCTRAPQPPQVAPESDAVVPPRETNERDAGHERWPRIAEMRAWPVVASNRPARGHFAEPALAEIRVSPESRDAYIGLVADRPLPDGATVAIAHRDARTSIPGPVFVMHKQAGAWTYLVLGPDGVIAAQGALGLCDTCHSLAPADHLFGVGSDGSADAGAGAGG